jgi:hypothetical protein
MSVARIASKRASSIAIGRNIDRISTGTGAHRLVWR